MKKLQRLASLLDARQTCIERNNTKWHDNHENNIEEIIDSMPSGSGIDNGNQINYEKSKKDRIVIDSGFHTMNENGYYTSWINYQIIITPNLQFLFDLKIKGNFSRNKDAGAMLKDYLEEIYSDYFANN